MGPDPVLFFANLFLNYYEIRWIRQLRKPDISRVNRFVNVFEFINDLAAINDWWELERSYKNIYPPDLELKKRGVDYSKESLLNLAIEIVYKKSNVQLYDERDDFSC